MPEDVKKKTSGEEAPPEAPPEEPGGATTDDRAPEDTDETAETTYTPEYDAHGYDQYGFDAEGYNAEGVHFSAWEEGATPLEVPTTPERPVETRTEAPSAPVQPSQAQQRPIYTKDNMWTAEERETLARLDLENPDEAANMRYDRRQWIENQAEDRFDDEIDEVARRFPTLPTLFGREIQQVRRHLSLEQKQVQGIGAQVAATVIIGQLATKPHLIQPMLDLLANDKGAGTPPEGPQKPSTTPEKSRTPENRPKPVIPPEMRPPTVRTAGGGARRVLPNRGGGNNDLLSHYREMYLKQGYTEAEVKEMTEGMLRHQEQHRGR